MNPISNFSTQYDSHIERAVLQWLKDENLTKYLHCVKYVRSSFADFGELQVTTRTGKLHVLDVNAFNLATGRDREVIEQLKCELKRVLSPRAPRKGAATRRHIQPRTLQPL